MTARQRSETATPAIPTPGMVKSLLTHSGTVSPLARKHAAKLRTVAAGLSFGLPLALSALALALPGALAAVCAVLAAPIALPGLVTGRRLFFAEAKHAVTLYYGADAA